MNTKEILKDIGLRTNGEIYLGVVGPVRSGKSTFIKRFIELAVLPNMSDEYEVSRTKDELPQSGDGKTIMTVEPKFVPADGVEIKIKEKYTLQEFAEDVLGITRNSLYRKLHRGVKFTKLEKDKIKEVLNIDL